MAKVDNLTKLRTAAAVASQRGCVELAEEIKRLLETAELACGPCVRCGGSSEATDSLVGALIKISFGASSRRGLDSKRGALCDDCCELLLTWAPGLCD
jgi:hypothetical protein